MVAPSRARGTARHPDAQRPHRFDYLERLIRDRRATVGVVGQGYVGYGLARRAAEVGFPTFGLDIDPAVVARRRAEGPYRGYRPTDDPRVLARCDVILLAVPTPTAADDAGRRPDLSIVQSATEMVARQIRGDARPRLFVSESTYAPGTTRNVVMPILRRVAGDDTLAVGYSPERIDPGNRRFDLPDIPKVTSGADATAEALTRAFYEQVVREVVPASSMEAAEATKLLENTFRFVNIAFAHEFDEYCHGLGLSSHEITGLAATKPFGFMPFFAGAGVGGHCIAEDPYFLYDSIREAGAQADLLATALRNHETRPGIVVRRIVDRLAPRPVEGARILLLGVAYKPNIGDTRRSPAAPILAALEQQGATVDYHDPHVPAFVGRPSVDLPAADPHDYDLAAVLVEHDAFDLRSLRGAGWQVWRLSDGAPSGARR
jgi:UDP-N-acetyl-D-glucosamine dehydrogenase